MANQSSSLMNVALRFQADVSRARAELKALRGDAEAVGLGAQKINTASIDKLAASANLAAIDTKGMGGAAKTASAEIKAQADASTAATAAAQAQAKAVNGVANGVYGANQGFVEFFAQMMDMYLNAVTADFVRVRVQRIFDLLSGQHLSAMIQQKAQNMKLTTGQVDRLLSIMDCLSIEIQAQLAVLNVLIGTT